MVTTAHSHDTTSVSASIACLPPWLATSRSHSSYWYLLRGFDIQPGSSDSYERGQPSASAQSRISFSGPPPDGPTPRMEAPIREECPVTTQKEPRTPYQQQVQAPVLSTHSTGVRRGAILEMMQRKLQELECQAATVGHRRGLSTKDQGAIPKKIEEAPGQGPPETGMWKESISPPTRKGTMEPISSTSRRQSNHLHLVGAPSAPPVQLGHFHPRHPADFSGEGWKKDADQAYLWHISATINVTAEEADALTALVTRHMEQNRCRWHFVKEDDPLWYSVLLTDFYEEVHGYCLNYLDHYIKWIEPHGWCHKVILQREQLNYCKHLTGVEPPPEDVERLR